MSDDLTTYTEADTFGRMSVAANLCTVTGMRRDENSGVLYKDFTTVHFAGDFTSLFSIKCTDNNGAGALVNVCNFGKTTGSFTGYVAYSAGYNEIGCSVFYSGGYNIRIFYDYTDASAAIALSASTKYWCKFQRISGTLYLYVYSDEAMTTLVDSETLVPTTDEDYDFHRVVQAINDGVGLYLSFEIGDVTAEVIGTTDTSNFNINQGARITPSRGGRIRGRLN